LGLSAVETGARILPLSITLLLAAAGIPKFFPHASPRGVVRAGLVALFLGSASMVAALDAGADPEIVTVPLLLAGLGVGALASQLGAITVSSLPDEASAEVGGLQNTVTNLGASMGTALAGSILIAALTSSFLTGIDQNAAVPDQVSAEADVELAGGVPFVSNADLEDALEEADVPPETADAIVEENEAARLVGLRTAISVIALMALIALFFTRLVPAHAVGSEPATARIDLEKADPTGTAATEMAIADGSISDGRSP
jgi:MFS family permease